MSYASAIETAKRVLELDAKASAGPWRVGNVGRGSLVVFGAVGHLKIAHTYCVYQGRPDKRIFNAAFFADSRTSCPQLARAVIEMAAESLFEKRLLASIRKEDCTCAEMTCNHCIAEFIEAGEFETADHCLSRLESLDVDARMSKCDTKEECGSNSRYWRCPCGVLVVRDKHYDLECGNCKRVQVDEDEISSTEYDDLQNCSAMPGAKAGATT